jgi:hypothetical protein
MLNNLLICYCAPGAESVSFNYDCSGTVSTTGSAQAPLSISQGAAASCSLESFNGTALGSWSPGATLTDQTVGDEDDNAGWFYDNVDVQAHAGSGLA